MNDYVKQMRKYIGHECLILVGSGVFIYKDGKMLLQKRRDDGLWADHGGCVEIGETLEETAARELFEETGLIANKLEFFNVYSGKELMYTYPNGDKAYMILTFWICEDFSGEIKIDTGEVIELKWFDINEIPEEVPITLKRPFKDIVKFIKKRDGI